MSGYLIMGPRSDLREALMGMVRALDAGDATAEITVENNYTTIQEVVSVEVMADDEPGLFGEVQ